MTQLKLQNQLYSGGSGQKKGKTLIERQNEYDLVSKPAVIEDQVDDFKFIASRNRKHLKSASVPKPSRMADDHKFRETQFYQQVNDS